MVFAQPFKSSGRQGDMGRKARTSSVLGQRLGRNVAAKRKSLGWLQGELAERLGVESETLSRFERGQVLPSLERLEQLAEILGTSLGELLSEASSNHKDQAFQIADWISVLDDTDRFFVAEEVKRLCSHFSKRKG